jgi:hypothetical protein
MLFHALAMLFQLEDCHHEEGFSPTRDLLFVGS